MGNILDGFSVEVLPMFIVMTMYVGGKPVDFKVFTWDQFPEVMRLMAQTWEDTNGED